MAVTCLVCEDGVEGELTCVRCAALCHFSCVIGCQVNNPKTRSSIKKGNFLCPICIVSRRDELTISAMRGNQQLHRENDINFALPATPVANGVTVEQDAEDTVEAVPSDEEAEERDAPEPPPPQPGNATAVLPTGSQQGADNIHVQDRNRGDAPPGELPAGFIPIHQDCETKGKKFLAGLKNMITLPKHATTLLVGDSLAHNINKKQVDPESDTLRVRSVGGMCVVAAVQALMRLERSYGNIKRLIWCLGTNDHLHRAKHCDEERIKYFKALETESLRVFPNATVSFVVPYQGMKKLNNKDISDLVRVLKVNCPRFKVHSPPSLRDKVAAGGVHPNKEGRRVITNFYRTRFFGKQRLFNKDSGQPKPGRLYAQAHIHNIQQSTVNGPTGAVQGNVPSAGDVELRRAQSTNNPVQAGELDSGDKRSLDSLLKNRLFELLLGQSDVRPPINRPPPWQYYNY